jgi:hypothetical protein
MMDSTVTASSPLDEVAALKKEVEALQVVKASCLCITGQIVPHAQCTHQEGYYDCMDSLGCQAKQAAAYALQSHPSCPASKGPHPL